MEALVTEFADRTFRYVQVERDGDIALFTQTHLASGTVRFEVVKIRIQRAHTWPSGVHTPDREVYPGSHRWGQLGWTCFTLEAAQTLARMLRQARPEET